MKTTIFGIANFLILFITLIFVLEISITDYRKQILNDNLSDVMMASMRIAMSDDSYKISDDDELVADVIQYLSVIVSNDCSLDVKVIKSDLAKGILKLKVTEHYNTLFNKSKAFSVTKTVIVDDYKVAVPNSYTLEYIIPGASDDSTKDVLFKKYIMQENSALIYPSTDNYNVHIKGWSLARDGKGGILSKEEITSMKLTKNYTFYAIPLIP